MLAISIVVCIVAIFLYVYIFPPDFVLDKINISDVYFKFQTHGVKDIALTIDDAPIDSTNLILQKLNQYKISATFFVIGQYLNRSKIDFKQDRHLVGNHDLYDRMSARIPSSVLTQDVAETDRIIREKTGQVTTWFRPGVGLVTKRLLNVVRPTHKIALASFYIHDPFFAFLFKWTGWDIWAQIVARHTILAIRPGSIIVLHDGKPERSQMTCRVLDLIVPTLQKRGYQFKTLDQMYTIHINGNQTK
jgi:peptidoglycan/xylan/chitin deacetylase (PgdA/CDA1 family)